jgi:hypothetical protein
MTHSGRPIDHVVVAVNDLDQTAKLYASLGFTLTPRAQHPWGTANRLAQFAGGNFIELLEIDRPELIPEHDFNATPKHFSFGAFNRHFLAHTEGLSMLVLAGNDSAADAARYQAANIGDYAPFDFERTATLPDGSNAKVAFSLAFATPPKSDLAAFFTCHNRFPEVFWKPQYQTHANGAKMITEVMMIAEAPHEFAEFFTAFSDGEVTVFGQHVEIACADHKISILTHAAAQNRYPDHGVPAAQELRMLGLVIETQAGLPAEKVLRAPQAGGMLIEFK